MLAAQAPATSPNEEGDTDVNGPGPLPDEATQLERAERLPRREVLANPRSRVRKELETVAQVRVGAKTRHILCVSEVKPCSDRPQRAFLILWLESC